jgi:hypothetical protein
MGRREVAIYECELKDGPRSPLAEGASLAPTKLKRNCLWKSRRSTIETTDL